MFDEQPAPSDRSELTSIITDIRRRWRLKLAVRGAAFVVAGFVLTLVLSAYALETLKFSPGSIIAFRVAMVMILGALAGYFFVMPQWRRVSDEQVALYLEECEPSLETAILSALEAQKQSPAHSPALARRLVEQAIERCGVLERGRRLEAQPLRRGHQRHRCRRSHRVHARSGIFAAGRVRTLAARRRRARSEPLSDRREAGQHDRAPRLRSGDHRHSAGFRVG